MMDVNEIKQAVQTFLGTGKKWAISATDLLVAYKAGHRDFRGANLVGANLGGAYLGDANLTDANLGGADLRGAYLRGANLTDANLRGACLTGANLVGTNLRGACLTGANLGGANLGGAYLGGAIGITRHTDSTITPYELFIVDGDTPMLKVGCEWVPLAEAGVLLDHEDVKDREKAARLLSYLKERHLGDGQ
jgi:hypothetical protein